MSSLVDCFSIIRDPRQESKIDHEPIDILILCVLAVICGAEGWQDIEEVGHVSLDWLLLMEKPYATPMIRKNVSQLFIW